MTLTPTILLIEHNDGHSFLIEQRLRETFPKAMIENAKTLSEANQKRSHRPWDLIIMNSRLPDGRGIDFLNPLSTTQPFVPVVILTDDDEEELESYYNHHGPIEFLLKDRHSLYSFITRVKRLMVTSHRIRHFFKEKHLPKTSMRDPLTQVYNRDFFQESLQRELSRANRYRHEFALLVVDVDHFRKMNDEKGYRNGDRCLKRLATLLEQSVRAGDMTARYEADKFVTLLTQCRSLDAIRCADRILERVKKARLTDPFTVSVGVLHYRGTQKYHSAQIISLAENALQKAKRQGGDRFMVVAA